VAAQLFAARTGAPVQLVSVLEPLIVQTFDMGTVPMEAAMDEPRRAMLRELIHDQLRRLLPASTELQVTLLDGIAAQVLAHVAHDRDARLLILGRGRHGLVDRLMLGETVLRALQLADVPVLAAEPGISELPKRVMIATDFSSYSVYAARVALSLMDPGATIYLAHAAPRTDHLETEFESVRREMGAEHMTVETVVLSGSPGRALVDFATSSNVDLVVSGTHGYGFFNRLILGSIATQLVRGAPCSVLAVPGSAATRAAARKHAGRGHTRSVPSNEWPMALATFSQRNARRQCSVEIDDVEIGAQVQGNALPLVGAAYDHHGKEVQLMFGASGLAGRYLSHVVPDVSGVELLADENGRDRALRVSSASGSTLVAFID
ncbi:MAG TPA: universal stress protein, partial [Gemmatimonadaceae bacterium]